jgi:hypothetical protein
MVFRGKFEEIKTFVTGCSIAHPSHNQQLANTIIILTKEANQIKFLAEKQ